LEAKIHELVQRSGPPLSTGAARFDAGLIRMMTPRSAVGPVAATRGADVRRLSRSGGALVSPAAWDPIRVALVSLMLISIARVHTMVPGLAVLRPGLLMTAVSLGLTLASPRAVVTRGFFSTWPVRRVAILLALACFGVPFGLGAGASVTVLTEVFLPNLVFAGLLVVAVRRAGDLRLLIGSYVVSIAILIFQTLFIWDSRDYSGFARANTSVMFDANDLGVLLAAGLPLSLLVAQTSTGLLRIVAYACAAGVPGAIAVLGTRGGFLALLVTGVGLLVMAPGITWRRRIGFVLAAVVGMALVAPDGYLRQMNTIVNPTEDYNVASETGRIAIWKRGLANLAENPVTGVGLGNFARAQWVNQAYTESGRPIRAQSPHNTFLQVAVDLGVPAFLVFMSIVYGATVGFARIRSRLPVSWREESAERRFVYAAASYLPVAFLGWSAGAFFVSHAYLVPFYILVAFAAGFIFLLRQEQSEAGREAFPAAPHGTRSPRRYARP